MTESALLLSSPSAQPSLPETMNFSAQDAPGQHARRILSITAVRLVLSCSVGPLIDSSSHNVPSWPHTKEEGMT